MAEKKMYKYQLVVGCHAEPVDKVVDKYDAAGNVTKETVRELVMYSEGDYFESEQEHLVTKLGADKFLKLPDNFDINAAKQQVSGGDDNTPKLPSSGVNFADWTEKELRAYAAEEEIDVSQCRNKADLVKKLKDSNPTLANSR